MIAETIKQGIGCQRTRIILLVSDQKGLTLSPHEMQEGRAHLARFQRGIQVKLTEQRRRMRQLSQELTEAKNQSQLRMQALAYFRKIARVEAELRLIEGNLSFGQEISRQKA